jgi:hypothetical protein
VNRRLRVQITSGCRDHVEVTNMGGRYRWWCGYLPPHRY